MEISTPCMWIFSSSFSTMVLHSYYFKWRLLFFSDRTFTLFFLCFSCFFLLFSTCFVLLGDCGRTIIDKCESWSWGGAEVSLFLLWTHEDEKKPYIIIFFFPNPRSMNGICDCKTSIWDTEFLESPVLIWPFSLHNTVTILFSVMSLQLMPWLTFLDS